ncbi:hypothetical protein D9611_001755 [Ephemerocybe angulata]|uniref:Ricin B lectin domain-containing protein n=1 Tax=Ephemerocybe angulata TaxID=980116 RepID=A0A8H5FMV6_9AGAR|nr:hypothetical protein D9611_001755 [Tulosesus angulatus]
MSNLSPGVRYHIQNIDSGKYLELQDRTAETEVKARPVKDSGQQLWVLVSDRQDPDVFMIENVFHKSWLGTITDGKRFSQLVGQNKANAGKWWITGDNDDGFRIGVAAWTKASSLCLELGEFGATLVQKRKQLDTQKWRFLTHGETFLLTSPQITSSLATGLYRIRTLDGSTTLSLSQSIADSGDGDHSDALALATSHDNPQNSNKWLVTFQASGLYSIQDADQHLFLGSPPYECYQYGMIHGLKEPFDWQISSVGGFAYTINTSSVSNLLSVGFRDYRAEPEKQLALMPAAQAHSQIWFFEPWEDYDTLSAKDPGVGASPMARRISDYGPGTTPGSKPLPETPAYLKEPYDLNGPRIQPFPEPPMEDRSAAGETDSDGEDGEASLPDGHYHIRNVGSGKYLNIATHPFLKAEPTHSPSRFLVRVSSSNSSKVQIIPHSYPGLHSLVWGELGLEVENASRFFWKLVAVNDDGIGRRFYLQPGQGSVIGVVEDQIELVDEVDPDSDAPAEEKMWDFVMIY